MSRKQRRKVKTDWGGERTGRKGDRRNQVAKPTHKEKIQASHKPPKPLEPLNQGQAEYIQAIHSHPYVIATGHAGTSKTYIPARIACHWFQQGTIDKIIIARPATSDSESLGFFKGTALEKIEHWIRPVKDTLVQCFGPTLYEYLVETEQILGVPFETIKGSSWDNAFIIIDEAEDCKATEIKKALTRLGTNSTMVLAGDITQSDLTASGLGKFLKLRDKSPLLTQSVDHIDFCSYDDIVRSDAVKNIIMGFDQAEGKLVVDEPECDEDWEDPYSDVA